MVTCPGCRRHLRSSEVSCPHCAVSTTGSRLSIAAVLLGLTACADGEKLFGTGSGNVDYGTSPYTETDTDVDADTDTDTDTDTGSTHSY